MLHTIVNNACQSSLELLPDSFSIQVDLWGFGAPANLTWAQAWVCPGVATSIFTYCKRSQTGGSEGLGMKLPLMN